jgi:DNA alkylation repair enzyme
MSLIKTVENELKTLSRRDQIEFYQKFFRTLKGDICEGDKILAIQIPQLRKVLKKYINQLTLVDIAYFLESEYNEFRFFGQQFIKSELPHTKLLEGAMVWASCFVDCCSS